MTDNKMLKGLGIEAKKAAFELGKLETGKKNTALCSVAKALTDNAGQILTANKKDVEAAKKSGMKESLIDRLMLDKGRITAMAEGVLKVAELPDPIGETVSMSKRPNGMTIGKIRVPIGVIGIIYEARPNVTSDAFSLCFKSGNAVILKGGSDAINSNIVITQVIRQALHDAGFLKSAISLIETADRETVREFMKMNEYVDLLIPRGGAPLIKSTVENSTIPVIETGTGNCHVYVDESADLDMAVNIIINAKTQRVGVCNACESLVIHSAVCDKYFPVIARELIERGVEIRGDERACDAARRADITVGKAENGDYAREYLDYIISVKTVDSIDEAIEHINAVNTKHSESIITQNYNNAQRFLNEIDAACVYVNASTRFTDGYEFGFGAEIGISTQKLHARGPMGLKELTSTKYIIYGNGQVR